MADNGLLVRSCGVIGKGDEGIGKCGQESGLDKGIDIDTGPIIQKLSMHR